MGETLHDAVSMLGRNEELESKEEESKSFERKRKTEITDESLKVTKSVRE